MITGALHKWIGKNNIHDELSLYSFSWLYGATVQKEGLVFEKGGSFFFSAYNADFLKRIIQGIKSNPEINDRLNIRKIIIQEDPEFGEEHTFYAASPILVKRNIEKNDIHFTYDQIESDVYMTETIKRKLKAAGLSEENISVKFDHK
jgi:CRISPR-associated endoribonuclease Cas6